MNNNNLFSLGMLITMLSGLTLYLFNNENVFHWTTLIWISFNIGCYLIGTSFIDKKENSKP